MQKFELVVSKQELAEHNAEEMASAIIERAKKCDCLEEMNEVFHFVLFLQRKLMTINDQRDELQQYYNALLEFAADPDTFHKENIAGFFELDDFGPGRKRWIPAGGYRFQKILL